MAVVSVYVELGTVNVVNVYVVCAAARGANTVIHRSADSADGNFAVRLMLVSDISRAAYGQDGAVQVWPKYEK